MMQHRRPNPAARDRHDPLTLAWLALTLALLLAWLGIASAEGTAAGTVIRNQATVRYQVIGRAPQVSISNEAVTVVQAVCRPSLTPDGTVLIPGQRVLGLPGTTQQLAFTLTNSGNATFDFDLGTLVTAESTTVPASVTIVADLDSNGTADPGEPPVSEVTGLGPDASQALVAVVVLDGDPATAGKTIYLARFATCRSQPTSTDSGNVARLDVATGGIASFTKSALPLGGTDVASGERIDYRLDLLANDVPLDDVEIRDVLDPRLGEPFTITTGTVTDPTSGRTADVSASFDTGSRELAWTIPTIPAGMTLRLGYSVQVQADATADQPIDNLASVTWSGASSGSDVTGSVTHSVVATCLPSLAPDGSVAAPGGTAIALPGATALLPFTFTNTGNATFDFELDTQILGDSTVTPADVALIHDANGNGAADVGEPDVSALSSVPPGATRELLLVVAMPASAVADDEAYLDVVARCAGTPTAVDQGNVALVRVPSGGIDALTKTATPAPGTPLAPGAAVSYTVSFTNQQLELVGVEVTDVLDPELAAPTHLTTGLVTDAATGLSTTVRTTYDPTTRQVRWSLDSVPATMTVELEVETGVLSRALASESIDNRAEIAWTGASSGTANSGNVRHPVASACELAITPDGSIQSPAHDVTAIPGEPASLSYTLTNLGNATFDFDVAAVIVQSTDPSLVSARIIRDDDGDGNADVSEVEVGTLTAVPPGGTVPIVLLVEVRNDNTVEGEAFVDLTGVCATDPSSFDDGNVASITVPPGGIAAERKQAEPGTGGAVYPGGEIRYLISFRAAQRHLREVVVVDRLDDNLDAPANVTSGTITDESTGLSTVAEVVYDAGEHELSWTIDEVPAGMNVELAFTATVLGDAQHGTVVPNVACLASRAFAERCTTPTEHRVEPLEILIEKSAHPQTATVGGTISYRLEVVNPSPDLPLNHVTVADHLPQGLRYRAGTARLVEDDDATELATIVDDRTLRWDISPLQPGARKTITFDAFVTVEALDAESLVNRVDANGLLPGGLVAASSADSVATVVDPGVFRARSVLMGRVFVDSDRGATPVSGVRLYLPSGVSTVTDEMGRFTFQGLTPGLTAVKVDTTTLPPRLLQHHPSQESPGLWRLRLQAGAIQRLDIPLVAPAVVLDMQQSTRTPTDVDSADPGEPTLLTRVHLDLSVYDIPPAGGLTVVLQLDEGERYVSGSLTVDGTVREDPATAPRGVAIELADAQPHSLELEFAHLVPSDFGRDRVSIVGRFPDPSLLFGSQDALAIVERATLPASAQQARVRERTGALFLAPYPGAVVRGRDAITVSIDMPFESTVQLHANGDEVEQELVGRRAYDAGLGRQTFDFVGVKLRPGLNQLRAVAEGPDGEIHYASVSVFLAGPPAEVTFEPAAPLVADSTAPIALTVVVSDAWGHPPQSDTITIEIEDAIAAQPDARPQEVGYQIRLRDGRGTLELRPFDEAGEFTVAARVQGRLGEQRFLVRTPHRPPLAVGLASLGVGLDPGTVASSLRAGADARFFVQRSLEDGSLFTFAADSQLRELGLYGDPYETFPVPGASQPLEQRARSRHGVYVRLDRDLSYLEYGDFETPVIGRVGGLSRSYTGLNGRYVAPDGYSVSGYLALHPVGGRVEGVEIDSDGTSVYRLPVAPVVNGSVEVHVIKRDAFDDRVIVDDDDPRTRALEPLIDYTVDERIGLVRLARALPLTDPDGARYLLVVGFTPSSAADAPTTARFGVQGSYTWEDLTIRAGGYQETGLAGSATRVLSTGAVYETDASKASVEASFGSDASTGGVALHAAGSHADGPLTFRGNYQYTSAGFRSADTSDDSESGHSFDASLAYQIDEAWAVSGRAQLATRSASEAVSYGATAVTSYRPDARIIVGDHVLGHDPTVEAGAEITDAGPRAIFGASLANPLGAENAQVRIAHLQALFGTVNSESELTVSYQILFNLSLQLTDRLTWGARNELHLGLEQVVEHRDALETVCAITDCIAPDGDRPLGRTAVIAQYALTGGVPDEAGRVRLGVDTLLPIDDEVSLDGSIEGTVAFGRPGENALVIGVGATYQSRDLDADGRFEVRIAELPKLNLGVGTTFALGRDTFGSVTIDWLHDAATSPTTGFQASLAGAYRGEAWDLLAKHEGRWGGLAPDGATHIFGDTRVTFAVDRAWDLRAGYLYRFRSDTSFLDMVTLGTTASPWDGGSVTAMGRLFHDWTEEEATAGVTVEASQRVGCGLYVVGGVNLFNRFGLGTPSIYTEPGPYLRLDLVFDEQFRCSKGTVTGTVFDDADGDGVYDPEELGMPGIYVALLEGGDSDGGLVETVVTDASGRYRFDRLDDGTGYTVRVQLPERYQSLSGVVEADRSYLSHELVVMQGAEVGPIDVGIVTGPSGAAP